MPRRRRSPIAPASADLDADQNPASLDENPGVTQRAVRRSTRTRRTVTTSVPYDTSGGARKRRQVRRRSVTRKTVVVTQPADQGEGQPEAIYPAIGAPENLGEPEIRNPLGLESEDVEPMNPARGASADRENIQLNTGANIGDLDKQLEDLENEGRNSPPRAEGSEQSFPSGEDIRVRDSSEDVGGGRDVRPDIPVE